MTNKKILISVAVVSALILAAVVWFAMQERDGNEGPGYRGRIVAETVHLSSKVPGKLAVVHIVEGDRVPAGTLIAELDFPELEARKNQAQGAADAAQAQYEMALNGATEYDLARAKASLAAAEAQYGLAEKSAGRLRVMYSDSLIAAQEYDEIIAKYQSAKAQKEAARLLLEDLETGTREEKIRMAKGDLDRALSALQEVESLYADRHIYAPKEMVIESVSLKSGELAPSGYTIISGYMPDDVIVRFPVPESETGRFRTGEVFTGRMPANGETITLEVRSVRALPAYATRSAAFPSGSFDEEWFEVRMKPAEGTRPDIIGNGQTVIIERQQS